MRLAFAVFVSLCVITTAPSSSAGGESSGDFTLPSVRSGRAMSGSTFLTGYTLAACGMLVMAVACLGPGYVKSQL